MRCCKFNVIDMYVLGLKFVEVAHDMQQQVAKYIRNDMGLLNSYDTWHGKALCFILIIFNDNFCQCRY